MDRLQLQWPIMGGEGEEEQKETPDVTALKAQVDQQAKQLGEYEKLLLDPAYLDHIANKTSDVIERKEVEKKQTEEAKDIGLDDMSRQDFAEYMIAAIQGEINKAVVPIKQGDQVRQATEQVNAAAQKFPDFWNYKQEMVQLSSGNPGLTAEQAYVLAKNANPNKQAPSSEIPSNQGNVKPAPQKGFQSKFDAAWEQVMGKGA